jgi:hypothetical protein
MFYTSGVDYITVSGMGGARSLEMYESTYQLLQERLYEGDEKRPWGLGGFKGWSCGHVQLGTRGREVLVRLGGEMAHAHWRKLYGLSDNCSRIDCQVTINNGDPPHRLIRRLYVRAKKVAAARADLGDVSILETTKGASTIYFNKRSSDRFGRIYDKGAESKLPAYQGAVRWEVEFKNKTAKRVSYQCSLTEFEAPVCLAHVAQFMSKRNSLWKFDPTSDPNALVCAQSIGFAIQTSPPAPLYRVPISALECGPGSTKLPFVMDAPSTVSDCSRQIQWLKTSVKRTVGTLMDRGFVDETLAALGLWPLPAEDFDLRKAI